MSTERILKKLHFFIKVAKKKKKKMSGKYVYDYLQENHGSIEQAVLHVCEKTGKSYSAVRSAYFRFLKKNPQIPAPTSTHGLSLLTFEEMRLLASVIRYRSMIHRQIGFEMIALFVRQKFKKEVSRSWVSRFLNKFNAIFFSDKGQALSTTRVRNASKADVLNFAEAWDRHVKRSAPLAKQIVNFDEFSIYYRSNELKVLKVFERGSNKNREMPKGTRVGSMVPFVNAEGQVISIAFVMKSRPRNENYFKLEIAVKRHDAFVSPRYPFHVYLTKTGYLDQSTMNLVMEKFRVDWKNSMTRVADSNLDPNGLDCYVLSDQLAIHVENTLRIDAFHDHFEMWPLPKNTSYFSQALDDVPFQTARNFLAREVEFIIEACQEAGVDWKRLLLDMMLHVVEERFTTAVLEAGFRNTKIWPWDKNAFIERGLQELGLSARPTPDAVQAYFEHFEEGVRMIHENLIEKSETVNKDKVVGTAKRKGKVVAIDPRELVFPSKNVSSEDSDSEAVNMEGHDGKKRRRKMPTRIKNLNPADRLCRGNCGKKSQGGTTSWVSCQCGHYFVCTYCLKKEKVAKDFKEHKKNCK